MIRVIILGLLLSAYAYSQYDEKGTSRDASGENSQTQFLTPDVVLSAASADTPAAEAVTLDIPTIESANTGNAPDITTEDSTAQQIQAPLFSNTGSPAQETSLFPNTYSPGKCVQTGSRASCLI